MPDLNTNKPWSPMDIADLRTCIIRKVSVAETARFLMRDEAEVAEKIAEIEGEERK